MWGTLIFCHKKKTQWSISPTASRMPVHLEHEFTAKLEGARIIHRSHLTKVAIGESGVDAVKLGVVEGVIGFGSKLDDHTLFDVEILEEAEIPVEETGANDCILVGGAVALVGSSLPGSGWLRKGGSVEPCQLLLRIAPRGR